MIDEAALGEKDGDGEGFQHAMVGDQVDQPAKSGGEGREGKGHEGAIAACGGGVVEAAVEGGDQAAHQGGRVRQAAPEPIGFAKERIEDQGESENRGGHRWVRLRLAAVGPESGAGRKAGLAFCVWRGEAKPSRSLHICETGLWHQGLALILTVSGTELT